MPHGFTCNTRVSIKINRYLECYADSKGDRVMGHMVSSDDMTPAVCREHCEAKDAMYYGTQVTSDVDSLGVLLTLVRVCALALFAFVFFS